jgi:hypothetical protein
MLEKFTNERDTVLSIIEMQAIGIFYINLKDFKGTIIPVVEQLLRLIYNTLPK